MILCSNVLQTGEHFISQHWQNSKIGFVDSLPINLKQMVGTILFITTALHKWRKHGGVGRWVEGSEGTRGGRLRDKCYNLKPLSGVRSLNYAEMWTACQWWGLSQSYGMTPHTHDFRSLLGFTVRQGLIHLNIYLSVCTSVYTVSLLKAGLWH